MAQIAEMVRAGLPAQRESGGSTASSRASTLLGLLGAAIVAGLIVFLPAGPALVGAALAALVALLRTPVRHRQAEKTDETAVAETIEAAGPAEKPEKALRSAHSDEEVAR
ncbi:hypothetical protein ACIP3U_23875 [[Kitasatospora] papulosa]|uniref:hypothetical protein n=1 Tax=[Kitasatospora] papulosa TaxID=1464011 RepID=UPI003817B4A0